VGKARGAFKGAAKPAHLRASLFTLGPALGKVAAGAGRGAGPIEEAGLASLQEITERLRDAVGTDAGLGKTLKLDFRADGCIHVDGGLITNDDKPADCTLVLTKDDFVALARGRLDPAAALMRGRLKVAGDMAVALKARELFARANP
jgi:putative sterol carrier protein